MISLPGIITAITADGLAVLLGQPTTATLSEIAGVGYQNWLNDKARTSHEILFAELKKGTRFASEVDPNSFFGLLHRYLNTTKQGAAQRNLRLMAQVIRGSLEQDCPFTPDELAANAELVATLSRNEIKFLATIWKSYVECSANSVGEQIQITTHNMTKNALIPSLYADESAFFAAGGALTRTGLIIVQPVWDGMRFDVTTSLSKLVKLCDLQTDSDETGIR